jgi:cytochrome c oxidase subunit 3
MSSDTSLLTPEERAMIDHSVLVRHALEEQFRNPQQQHEAASLGIWLFLVTEVMFFGALFVGLGAYRSQYPVEFEKASLRLNWIIGGSNTIIMLASSLFMVLAVHSAKQGQRRALLIYLSLTALLGLVFLGFKGLEYYLDYRDNLIPGWKFVDEEWVTREGLHLEQVKHVKLFLLFYWIMTSIHGLHMIIGIALVGFMIYLVRRGHFSPAYYSPIDFTGLYWHFVDMVWIFLLPMLYLIGTHSLQG